jgi:hypothetical protein
MDPVKNPFSPGAGTQPPELAGRAPILEQARILLGRVKQQRSEKSMLLTGLRGVGKTVLLISIRSMAYKENFLTAMVESHDGKRLHELLTPYLRQFIIDLSTASYVGDKLKKAALMLKSFVKSLKISINDFNIGVEMTESPKGADSGDLEVDLPELFVALGEAAKEQNRFIAFFIDEIQYLELKELSALVMAMHKVQQGQLPIVLVGAGLPVLTELLGESKSYVERLFSFPDIGALTEQDSMKALQDPARASGVIFNRDAIDEIYRHTKGYPYFIQEWGYHSWNRAPGSPITLDAVKDATNEAIARLDSDFFRVRFDRCTPSEKRFMLSIAKLGNGPNKTNAIAEQHGVKAKSIGPVRATLIKKGMIFSPAFGEIQFTVPLFGEFILRKMKELPSPMQTQSIPFNE